MKRIKVKLIIDLVMFISILNIIAFGLIIKFGNLHGANSFRGSSNNFLGLQKSICCDLHFIFSLIFAAALILHLILNWKTIKCYFDNIV